jgi:hypothetical protein
MTQAGCQLIGRRRIVKADLRNRSVSGRLDILKALKAFLLQQPARQSPTPTTSSQRQESVLCRIQIQ